MNQSPHITIVVINFNGAKFLPQCLKSLQQQTYVNCALAVIDNLSTDQSTALIAKQFPQIALIKNLINTGYAGAANQAYQLAAHNQSDYLMILNPDIILTPSYIEKALQSLAADTKIAGFTGKSILYDFQTNQPTNQIDTIGLHAFRNRRIVDFGQGQQDNGQFGQPQPVFGISGSCPIYRLSALRDIIIPKASAENTALNQPAIETPEIFDTDFFLYKEDIDVSWRLRLYGWKLWYSPTAIVYHRRGTGILKEFSHQKVYQSRHKLSFNQKYYAYKNQRLMQIKNEIPFHFIRDFFPIITKEILILGYIIFREPRLIKSVFALLRQMPNAFRKRKIIQRKRQVTTAQIKKWFTARPK